MRYLEVSGTIKTASITVISILSTPEACNFPEIHVELLVGCNYLRTYIWPQKLRCKINTNRRDLFGAMCLVD